MADPVSLLQSERIRQALKDRHGQVDSYSAAAGKWRSNTYPSRVESAPVAATSVTTPLLGRTSPAVSRIHDKMAVATAPSIGFFLPTPQPVPSTLAIATTSSAVGVRISSSRPTKIATVVRPVTTGGNQFLTTPKPIPRYSGAGNLLVSSCTAAEYTLVDAGSSLYYVPFIGCINKKPNCCPFSPKPTGNGNTIYPQPINQEDAVLNHCPADYHSVSGGGCCPSGYTPWTALLGGQTPCFSSVKARRTPQATTTYPGRSATGKPTVVVADSVFAMQYTTEQPPGGLSGGAIAGIVIGVLGGILLSAGLAYVFIRRRRARNPGIDLKSENGGGSSYRGTPAPPEIPNPTSNTQTREMGSVSRGTGQGFEAPPSYEAPSTERLRDQEPLRIHVSRSSARAEDLSQKPSPGDQDDLDEGYTFESGASSLVQENTGILEVQLARPERLSRGYARIVYTQAQGSGSSIHTDGKSIRSDLTEPR